MYRRVLVGLMPILCAAVVPASVAQPPRVVTEAEFLSVLVESHPALTESEEDLALTRARVLEASLFDNPVLEVVREDPSGPVAQTDWTLSWQLPHAARRASMEARENEVEGAEARLAQYLLALRLTMREVYADWALATVREERLAAQAKRVERLAEREAARAERGESSGLEARRLKLAAGELSARVALAAAAREQARAKVTAWFPALPPQALPVLPDVPPLPSSPEAGPRHPRLQAAEADLTAARLEGEIARRFILSPEVTVGWQRQANGSESIGGAIVGVAWSIPLFDRSQDEKAAAQARIAGAQARLERAERELESSRPAARATLERLIEAVSTAKRSLAESELMLDGVEAAFRHGEASLTDLLDITRSVTEAELSRVDLQGAVLAAQREFERQFFVRQEPEP